MINYYPVLNHETWSGTTSRTCVLSSQTTDTCGNLSCPHHHEHPKRNWGIISTWSEFMNSVWNNVAMMQVSDLLVFSFLPTYQLQHLQPTSAKLPGRSPCCGGDIGGAAGGTGGRNSGSGGWGREFEWVLGMALACFRWHCNDICIVYVMLCDVLCVYNLLPEHRCRILWKSCGGGSSFPGCPTCGSGARNAKKHAIFEWIFGGWTANCMSLFFRDLLILLQQHSEHPQVSRIWSMSSSYELTEADRILGRCNSMASEWTPGWHLRDHAVCSMLLQNLDNLVWVGSCECGDISMLRHHQYGEGSTWKPRRKSSLSGFVSKRKRGVYQGI